MKWFYCTIHLHYYNTIKRFQTIVGVSRCSKRKRDTQLEDKMCEQDWMSLDRRVTQATGTRALHVDFLKKDPTTCTFSFEKVTLLHHLVFLFLYRNIWKVVNFNKSRVKTHNAVPWSRSGTSIYICRPNVCIGWWNVRFVVLFICTSTKRWAEFVQLYMTQCYQRSENIIPMKCQWNCPIGDQ